MLRGASAVRANQEITRNKNVNELKLWGRALERLQAQPDLGLVTTIITQNDLREFNTLLQRWKVYLIFKWVGRISRGIGTAGK